mmetsp:Transcript_8469/g.35373  ORF Transcript_8469/g.35373 Transcript_8469/m.35373 type:complete len:150 (-) Transcript_8469:16-465(-)
MACANAYSPLLLGSDRIRSLISPATNELPKQRGLAMMSTASLVPQQFVQRNALRALVPLSIVISGPLVTTLAQHSTRIAIPLLMSKFSVISLKVGSMMPPWMPYVQSAAFKASLAWSTPVILTGIVISTTVVVGYYGYQWHQQRLKAAL